LISSRRYYESKKGITKELIESLKTIHSFYFEFNGRLEVLVKTYKDL